MRLALSYLFIALCAGVFALAVFGPYEDATLDLAFSPSRLDGGVDAYLTAEEAKVAGLTPGTEKRVIWAGEAEAKTPLSVVYIHGFSATSEEIRPVPDRVAQALGANLVYTRLTGHGAGSAAMAEATVQDWTRDTGEAIAIGAKVGARVLVIATSTGATLATYAATRPIETEQVAGMVLISPNYALNNAAAGLLTWPAARYWVGLIAGKTRSFEPKNEAHAQFWTTSYPTIAALPMAALVKAVSELDLSSILMPALFIYAEADQVVSPRATKSVIAQWGSGWNMRTEVYQPVMGPGDDPFSHVIAGDVMSPGQTDAAVQRIVDFARSLE
ncbi:MAG: alpha/beta fold hydrolase [Pseudomonadota bacterium]